MIVFAEDGLSLDVRVDAEKETVWLTQAEMAELSVKVLSLDTRTQANEERVKALEKAAKRGECPSESVFYSGEFLDARALFAYLLVALLWRTRMYN